MNICARRLLGRGERHIELTREAVQLSREGMCEGRASEAEKGKRVYGNGPDGRQAVDRWISDLWVLRFLAETLLLC